VRHRKVDGCAVGYIQKQHLRGGDMKDMRQRSGVCRQWPLQAARQQGLDRHPEPQRRGQDCTHQTSVTHVEREIIRMAVLVVCQAIERRMRVDNRTEQFCCYLARRKARDVRL
jgi:hypothetical protein